MSEANITIKLWHDGKAPRLSLSYQSPAELFEGNGHSYLQMRKMLSDYFGRKDVTVEVKENMYLALEYLSKAFIANTTPSPEEVRNQIAKDMNRLYNTNLEVNHEHPHI